MGRDYQKRKALGLCTNCGVRAAISGITLCEECRQYRSRYYKNRTKKRKELAACIVCSNPKEQLDKAKCNSCLVKMNNYMKQRRAVRIAAGKCTECGAAQKEESSSNRCDFCYLKMISSNVFGTTSKFLELEDLLSTQEYRCAYSGRLLILQENCELDHITPLAKGGPNDLDNLQWVHRDVNKMKFDLEEEIFLETVIQIARHKNLTD